MNMIPPATQSTSIPSANDPLAHDAAEVSEQASGRLLSLQQLSREQCQAIRLIASDMDGTLTQQEKFQPELLMALQRLQQAKLPLVIVTGRSAGWVQAVAHYLPVAGAIAENGGLCYLPPHYELELLVEIGAISEHRRNLAQAFAQLQQHFPNLQESTDNQFRVTDWTFDVAGLSEGDLRSLQQRCQEAGWGFTYSTVQCHIRFLEQDKGRAVKQLLTRLCSGSLTGNLASNLTADNDTPLRNQVLTLGDSPNDASLFNPKDFPVSVGVANIQCYADVLPDCPRYVTQAKEGAGFCELVDHLLNSYQ